MQERNHKELHEEPSGYVQVKICGITRLTDALTVEQLGASAVGFVFFPGSPRYITFERAGAISRMLGPFIARVGVFVDSNRDRVAEAVEVAGLTAVQLHGSESPEYVDDIKRLGVWCIKSFRVGPGFECGRLADYDLNTFLLDTLVGGACYGGTGKTFDWTTALECRCYGRIILAGGLNSANVGDAIRTVRPWAVDVSSGVELHPGVKDPGALKAFFTAVHDGRSDDCGA